MSEDRPTLLVVDDNEDNRFTLTRRLKREGYTNVVVAENGRQALDALAERPFDLVLLDIMMPEMDGYQVLEHLKSDMALRDIPVIMISALDELDSVVRCIKLGAEDYLPKPFNAVLLKARIGACLEKKRLRDQEASYLKQIESEKKRADELLHAILPAAAVRELKTTNSVKSRRFEDVAVLCSRFAVISQGQLIAETTPAEARKRLTGKIFEGRGAEVDLAVIRRHFLVTQAVLVEGENLVRVYAPDAPPPPGFEPANPTIEDAYMSLVSPRPPGSSEPVVVGSAS